MNLISYTKYFGSVGNIASAGKKFLTKTLNSSGASGLNTGIGIAAGGVGLATAGIGLSKALSDKNKFTVVFMGSNGPQKMVVKAVDKITARNRVQSKSNGTDYKVFNIPTEDDMAMEYYEHLESKAR